MEVSAPKQFTQSININLPKLVMQHHWRLQFKKKKNAVKPIIQRNQYRHARVELGLYLLLDSKPTQSNANLSTLPSTQYHSCSATEDY
jgi:hypothetical protein